VLGRTGRWCDDRVGDGSHGRVRHSYRAYLGALGLERDDLVQALGLSFTVSTLALAAGLAWPGLLPLQAAGTSLLALVPTLAGMALGGWLRARVRPEIFRLCFFVGLLVLGGELVWRGWPEAVRMVANSHGQPTAFQGVANWRTRA